MQIVVDDLLIHYQLQGSGKLVVFLHGWGDASAGSADLQAELAKNYTVLAPDLPGFGQSQRPPTAWTIDNYVQCVAALLTKLNNGTPYAVIGHSNGGAIAVRALALQALPAEKLVLLGASGIRKRKTLKRAITTILAKVGNIATIGMPQRYRNALRKQLYKTSGSDMLAVPSMQETFKNIVRQDVQRDAQKITQPTLLVYGANDTDTPPAFGKQFATLIKNASYKELSDAGHFVHLDQPVKTYSEIREFLG